MKRTKGGGRRRIAVGGAVVAAAAGLTAAALVATRDDGPPADRPRAKATRTGSVVVPGAEPVTIERTPVSYRIVYRLEEFTGPDPLYSTDKVWVRRPFESRLETWRGKPPGSSKLSTQTGAFAIRRNESKAGEPVVIGVPPDVAPSDIRLAPALDARLSDGLIERREVRRILDRPCQIYRTGQLLSASRFVAPGPGEYTDSCVDAAGIVLEEILVVDRAILSRRVATEVEEDPGSLDDALFRTGPRTLDVIDGGGLVRRLGPGTPPGEFLLYDPASIPEGFEYRGRFNVIPSQPENFKDPERFGLQETSFADVFVRGADFLVIDQGGTRQGADPFVVDPEAPTLDLGPFGQAEVRLGALGVEVRVKRTGGRFLRVRGTLPPEQLASVARAVIPTEGAGPLEFLEEPGS